eukprot:scaffold13785_cov30-Tisochrysis_lutea.AAC.3
MSFRAQQSASSQPVHRCFVLIAHREGKQRAPGADLSSSVSSLRLRGGSRKEKGREWFSEQKGVVTGVPEGR